ncbi:hypothetical protein [Chengkuizengella axinellae]|uniref:Uncharacterized protein n=1 Tax=Chengkuizengella axinellae TaxID=3064388 RepID=A0ABT9J6K8_9BACL|nr:hypothetical protein [Chengkuizengella sp. 2205SS18-9]MDP5277235.1 hypothetical protein [Chengkuizengella sp. 2205SS18-9]
MRSSTAEPVEMQLDLGKVKRGPIVASFGDRDISTSNIFVTAMVYDKAKL